MKITHVFTLILGITSAFSLAAPPQVLLEPVVRNLLKAPTSMANAGDGSNRLFITEQTGQVLILTEGMLRPSPFLDVSSSMVTLSPGLEERGLLGIAFHPDYEVATSSGKGKFYVYYSIPHASENHASRVSEFSVSNQDANIADSNSERIILEFTQPQPNHNGGQLAFGPDGYLYISTGDGGGSNDNDIGHTGGNSSKPDDALGNAQDRTNLLGKILRIDPAGTNGPGGEYGIPPTNPFANANGSTRKEIFAYGLRNPWRFSFDTGGSNRLFCADVGQFKVEEVNLIESGKNYGWRAKEGNVEAHAATPNPHNDSYEPPIASYAHFGTTVPGLISYGNSVTGGYVYRGSQNPGLNGIYLFADWGTFQFGASFSGQLLALEEDSPGLFSLHALDVVESTENGVNGSIMGQFINAFGQDEAGEIYVLSKASFDPALTDGSIYKIVEAQEVTVSLTPTRDNSLYEENPSRSNGSGEWLFAGKTGGSAQNGERRLLMHFDIEGQIPGNAIVSSASLAMHCDRASFRAAAMNLHRLTGNWGEGASDAPSPEGPGIAAEKGDATWNSAFYDPDSPQNWLNPGGDFIASGSLSTPVNITDPNTYQFSSTGMVHDVNSWLTGTSNHGWIMINSNSSSPNAKRFISRNSSDTSNHPTLSIRYFPGSPQTNRQQWIHRYTELGEFIDDLSDTDGDGLQALVEYAMGLDPKTANPNTPMFAVDEAGNNAFTYSFRRDTAADDLNYYVETSKDLISWTTIVNISGTGTPTGTGFAGATPDPADTKYSNILVSVPGSISSETRTFLRLRIVR